MDVKAVYLIYTANKKTDFRYFYTEEICNRYFISLKVRKIEDYTSQPVWPYLLIMSL